MTSDIAASGGMPGGADDSLTSVTPRSPLARTVLKYYEMVDANDVDGLVALFTTSATYVRPGYETFDGRDALRSFYEGERVIESGTHSVTLMVEDPGHVFVEGTFAGVSRSGEDLRASFVDVFEGEGQLVRRRRTYFHAPLLWRIGRSLYCRLAPGRLRGSGLRRPCQGARRVRRTRRVLPGSGVPRGRRLRCRPLAVVVPPRRTRAGGQRRHGLACADVV